ncbi:DUF4440 domain-containing protein [Rhizobium sp. Root1220]|uniref:DUF4440 domain-containing protein n=1 Tax=Rhizobium sp. Root1220 TaxID=1736432 RepID=UPI0006FA17F6|nr:DUF4440 domain-containing protein [Rhizobium sp. Root1220]KQV83834.1 hypothetical protein ASC90_19430 [Rhizobium sp. Root1220]
MTLLLRASAEIVDLHRFFVDWYDMKSAAIADFGRFERVMGDGFHMVPPSGLVLDRDAVVSYVKANRATHQGDFAIDISDIRPGWQSADAIIVCYIETQRRGGKESRRQASALFTTSSSTPHGVEWRHLHETWLQVPES